MKFFRVFSFHNVNQIHFTVYLRFTGKMTAEGKHIKHSNINIFQSIGNRFSNELNSCDMQKSYFSHFHKFVLFDFGP